MRFENTEVFNFDGALRGMRNPLESWGRSDSGLCDGWDCSDCRYNDSDNCDNIREFTNCIIGDNDLALMQRLILAGDEHAKFMRQIFVSVDITAPLYWYKEFDTYKIGTTANSESTMHKLASTPITLDCFEIDDYVGDARLDGLMYKFDETFTTGLIDMLENLRLEYLKTNDKRYWKELIRWLPSGWLQTRTVTMSYANVRNMIGQRSHHKLTEWSVDFITWCKSLPYSEELLFVSKKK